MKIKETVTNTVALVGGGIGANFIYNKATMVENAKLRAAIPLLAGIGLSMQKNKLMQMAGYGMIATGGQKLVGAFVPALAGFDADEVIEGIYEDDGDGMNGATINGDNVINGPGDDDDDYMNGSDEDYD